MDNGGSAPRKHQAVATAARGSRRGAFPMHGFQGLGQDKEIIAAPVKLYATPLVMSPEQAAQVRANVAAKQQAAAEQAAMEAALLQQMMMATQQEEEKGLPTWAWALIGVGGAGVILAAMYFLVFKKKGSGGAGEEPEVKAESLPPTAADNLTRAAAGIHGDDDWGKYLRR